MNPHWFKEAEKKVIQVAIWLRGAKRNYRVHLSQKPQTWRCRRGKDHVAHRVIWNENSCSLAILAGVLPP